MSIQTRNRLFLAGGAFALALTVFLLAFFEFIQPLLGQSPIAQSPTAENKKKNDGANEKTSAEAQAVAVTVAKVEIRSIQRTVDVVGSFEGYEEVTLTPKVDGRVIRVNYDVGDIVHPGDVLLEIDPTDYKLAAEEAQKSIESELAKVGLAALPGPEFDINKLPTVVRAANQYRNASSRFSRIDSLYKQKISSKEEWEQAYTDNEVAKATLDQVKIDAQANIAKARQQAAIRDTAQQRLSDTKVEVPVPSATLAKLARTLQDVERTVMQRISAEGEAAAQGVAASEARLPSAVVSKLARSPQDIEYVVAERMIAEGEMATRANPKGVFRLVIDKLLKYKAAVPEVYTGQVKLGQKVQIRVEAYPEKVFQGVVSRVSPTVDRLSRTFQIEALVPNQSRELKPGGFAKASILSRVETQAKTVPVEALVTAVGTTKIFVVKGGAAHALEVKTGAAEKTWVEISADLDPDSQVITSGQNQLAEGTKVKVR
jgi:RND family efflux transporter MFP subunit